MLETWWAPTDACSIPKIHIWLYLWNVRSNCWHESVCCIWLPHLPRNSRGRPINSRPRSQIRPAIKCETTSADPCYRLSDFPFLLLLDQAANPLKAWAVHPPQLLLPALLLASLRLLRRLPAPTSHLLHHHRASIYFLRLWSWIYFNKQLDQVDTGKWSGVDELESIESKS